MILLTDDSGAFPLSFLCRDLPLSFFFLFFRFFVTLSLKFTTASVKALLTEPAV
jgi:hypothetical protein